MSRWIVPIFCLLAIACRGQFSDKPPLHFNPNMDDTERYDAQEANLFFADGRAGRPRVAGTVARGTLEADPVLYRGRTEDGLYVLDNPLTIDKSLLLRGQERYNIYCAVCHDRSGGGRGMAIRYPENSGIAGFPPPPSFHEERLRDAPDGQIFDTITHGARTMPPYADRVAARDRWAIVAYIRALQRSQDARREDVPREILDTWEPL